MGRRVAKQVVTEQALLPFHRDGRWGGARPGAGRKPLPLGKRKGVPHRRRGEHKARFPVHVTVRLRDGLRGLRRKRVFREMRRCFAAGCARFGFRLVHYSVQSNHVHLMVEARDRRALSRGMQGLLIRLARALNRVWGRRGQVWRERYHEHVLKTPREVRRALCYVLNNVWRHRRRGPGKGESGVDEFASGCWFDGWRPGTVARAREGPLPRARTWLLGKGWRRCGLLVPGEVGVLLAR